MAIRSWVRVGAVLGALAVAIGAFGAHGLKGGLERAVEQGERTRAEADRALAVFETGARYHLLHALAIVAVGLSATWRVSEGTRSLAWAGWLFLAGTVLFSGSLYALALTGVSQLGAITPVGGLAFLGGWVALAVGAPRSGPA